MRLWLVALATMGFLCVVSTASAAPAWKSIPLKTLTEPNRGGKVLSIDSGLEAPKACSGVRDLFPIWRSTAGRFNIRWQTLAALTKIESRYGCELKSANSIGWMQLTTKTWKLWGMDADGDGDADPNNAVDAIFSSARYLRASGAPKQIRKALSANGRKREYVNYIFKTARSFGNIKIDEATELASIDSEWRDAQHQAGELQEDYRVSRTALKRTGIEERVARRQLDRLNKDKKVKIIRFEQERKALDKATVEYLVLVDGVSENRQYSTDGDQQALQYMSGSNPQDAVLVYQTTQSFLNTQTQLLADLRTRAQQANVRRAEIISITAKQDSLVKEAETALVEQQKLTRDNRESLEQSQERLIQIRKLQRRYKVISRRLGADVAGLTNGTYSDGLQTDPSIPGEYRWPVKGSLTSPFNPNRCLNGVCRPHKGLDISAPVGEPVRASKDGRVSLVQSIGESGGYGNFVCVRHDSEIETCYAHNTRVIAKVGGRVSQGDMIARAGNTGHSFGSHVHFEVRINGVAVDPIKYMPKAS